MSGFLLGGFAKGIEGLGPFLLQRERLKIQQEEGKLRQKMLDLQTKKLEQGIMDDERQRQAVESMARTFEQGQPFDRPPGVEGPLMESGAFGQTPGNPQMAAMMRAQPKEVISGLMRQQTGGGANTQMSRGFATLEEAQAAARQGGISSRIEQTPWGWFVKEVNPVNVPANAYHRTLAATGNEALARQAFTDAMFAGSTAAGAGTVSGKAGQELGEPAAPFVGIQGQQAPQSGMQAPGQPGMQAPPPPLAQPARPQVDTTPRPTPAGGSQSQRALRQREAIQRQERPLEASTAGQVSAIETLLGATIPNIRKNFSTEHLGPIQGRDFAFEARRQVGSMIGMPVTGSETTFRTALKDAGDQLLRARSGAQINEQEYLRLQSILPKPTDEPQVFMAALDRFESELRTLLEAKRRTAAEPRGMGLTPRPELPPPPAGWR